MGFRRLFLYYKHRVGRIPGTPSYIASGFATGVAVSFTPFIGFHIASAGLVTWMLRGSMGAMVLGSVLAGNPWTFPFIWVTTYQLGEWMLGAHVSKAAASTLSHSPTFAELMAKPWELLLPMTLGSLPLVIVSWGISFAIVRRIVRRYKEARLARIYKETKL